MSIKKCKLIYLPKIEDERGNLTFIEGNKDIPFPIKRIYYLYGVPNGSERGGHAHKNLEQLIIPISGSFDLLIDDGFAKQTIHMKGSNMALYVCPMIWRELSNFSPDAVCVVLASEHYDEADYHRNYPQYLKQAREKNEYTIS
ncbi:MAG: FdtA/QdtA family cupin domain-containing protein [Gammaproteobacteria bacterium]